MSHSKLTRALLSVLVLSSAPLMAAAISDDVDLRFDGGALQKDGAYLVHEGDSVSLAALAAAGDVVWIIAAPADKGIVDWSAATTLLRSDDRQASSRRSSRSRRASPATRSCCWPSRSDAKGEMRNSNMLRRRRPATED